jgi:hypothetical protein
MSARVNKVSTFTECAKEERSEDAHAEYRPEYGVLGRFFPSFKPSLVRGQCELVRNMTLQKSVEAGSERSLDIGIEFARFELEERRSKAWKTTCKYLVCAVSEAIVESFAIAAIIIIGCKREADAKAFAILANV